MSDITKGIVERSLKTSDLVLTETYHQPRLRLGPHDHEHANINIVLDGHVDEAVEPSNYRCDKFSSLVKPSVARHSNQYGLKQTHCLIIEFMPQLAEHDARQPRSRK